MQKKKYTTSNIDEMGLPSFVCGMDWCVWFNHLKDQLSFWNMKAQCLVVKSCCFNSAEKGQIKSMELKGSQTQIGVF